MCTSNCYLAGLLAYAAVGSIPPITDTFLEGEFSLTFSTFSLAVLLFTGVTCAVPTFELSFAAPDRFESANILLLTREDAFESNTWILGSKLGWVVL